jgi:hypothetical protein
VSNLFIGGNSLKQTVAPLSKSKLYELRRSVGVETIRKSKANIGDATQAIVDIKSADLAGRWGVAQVRQRLANQEKRVFVSRYCFCFSTFILNLMDAAF